MLALLEVSIRLMQSVATQILIIGLPGVFFTLFRGLSQRVEAIKAVIQRNKALRQAASDGDLQKVMRLLEIFSVRKRAHVHENEALRLAAAHGHGDIVAQLLEIPHVKALANVESNEALRRAAAGGYVKIVKLLLAIPLVKAHADANRNEAFREAATGGHADVVTLLLESRDVHALANIEENEALRHAAAGGHADVVKLLLEIPEVRAQASIRDNEALRFAAKNAHVGIVDLLLTLPAVCAQVNTLFQVWTEAKKEGHTAIAERVGKIPEVQAFIRGLESGVAAIAPVAQVLLSEGNEALRETLVNDPAPFVSFMTNKIVEAEKHSELEGSLPPRSPEKENRNPI